MINYSWLEPLFFLGARREVGQDDLYAHPKEADSKQLLEKFNRLLIVTPSIDSDSFCFF